MRTFRIAMGAAAVACLSTTAALAQAAPASPPAAPAAAAGPARSKAPAGAGVYIIAPVDGARLRGPFVVRFGLKGMGVTQAGSAAKDAGHHHLFVDATDALDPNGPIPADKTHLHFGGGQTEIKLDLPPGRHTLQLVLGDAGHRLFDPSLESPKITVVVLSANAKVKPKPMRHHRKRMYRSYYGALTQPDA